MRHPRSVSVNGFGAKGLESPGIIAGPSGDVGSDWHGSRLGEQSVVDRFQGLNIGHFGLDIQFIVTLDGYLGGILDLLEFFVVGEKRLRTFPCRRPP